MLEMSNLFSDFANERHLVKRQFVFPGRTLHDGSQEGLRIEESGQPDGDRQAEVGRPRLQLFDPEQKVGVPVGKAVQRCVSAGSPT